MKYDYIIVGAGIFGSVCARELSDAGAKCLVIDKRQHIGGNCYTQDVGGIHVHQYGPHIFHTNSDYVWNYVNKFCKFNHFRLRPKVRYNDSLYSFPINLMTLHQVWGVKTPEEAEEKLQSVRVSIENPQSMEEYALSQIGEELYNIFIKGYSQKQWGKDPRYLPSKILKRIPIRMNFNDNYFDDEYQGVPIGGYTQIFHKLLDGIEVRLSTDYLGDQARLDLLGKKTIYTGGLDEFFSYDMGELEWRSLRFQHERLEVKDFQGCAVVNYADMNIAHTRLCEHKHFEFGNQNHTVITKEYPQIWDKSKEKYYPINDKKNNALSKKYKSRIDQNKYIFGGRLADYAYYDMHHVVASALKTVKIETL
jgi:UDP-galactopyranose mutase